MRDGTLEGRSPAQVSVAMATYNGASNLLSQLKSLAEQSLLPFELVVTDDGSTDTTIEVLERFAEGASFPVRIYRNEERLGYGNNFLKAALLCASPLIAFCDQDDVWHENKLALQSRSFEDADVLACIHQADVWDGSSTQGLKYPEIDRTEVHLPGTLDPLHLVPGFVMMFRSQLLQLASNDRRPRNIFTLGKPPGPMAHDQWIWFLATVTGKVATLEDTLALYRQHTMNVVGAPKNTGRLHGLLLALVDSNYREMGELELECARVAKGLAEGLTQQQRLDAQAAGASLELRAQYHLLRSVIYQQGWLGKRSMAFLRIFVAGGYRNKSGKYSLGRQAMVKDLCLGVPAAYRLTMRRATL